MPPPVCLMPPMVRGHNYVSWIWTVGERDGRGADSADSGNSRRGAQQYCNVSLWPHALHWNVSRQRAINEVSANRARWMDRLSRSQLTGRQGLPWPRIHFLAYFLTLLFVRLTNDYASSLCNTGPSRGILVWEYHNCRQHVDVDTLPVMSCKNRVITLFLQ